MLLTIDVGNTNTVLGVFNKDKLEQSWRVKTDPRDTADELWLQYAALVDGFDITGVAICSTVPAVLREIRKLIDEHYSDINTTIIEPGVKTGVPLLVDNPKEIGGIEISVDALAARAAQLRKVELVKPKSVIGKNTVEALQSGTIYGFAGQVDGLVNRITDELADLYPNSGEVCVIATGGLAPLVLGISETIEFHEPDLTLIGLRLVHERN